MENIKPSRLTRNSDLISTYFKIVGDVTVTTKDIRIVFPSRYVNRGLAVLGSVVKTLSMYAIIDEDDNYAVCLAPIIQTVAPYNITDVIIDNRDYKVLYFNAGDVVITNNNLVMNEGFMYELFDEFIVKGNIPFYLNYYDVSDIFKETKKFAGSNIGKNMLTFEILSAVIARDPNDKAVFFRQTVKTQADLKKQPVYVGLNNVFYSLSTTTAKIVGGYFGQGITTALVAPEQETSSVSEILRK